MKRVFVMVVVWIVVSLLCIFAINKCALAEVMLKYNGKICKMEIFTSENIKNRNAKKIITKQVMEFCEDKYIYDVNVAADNGVLTYIIFYNDKASE